ELVEHLEGATRGALAEDLVELLEDPRGAALDDLPAQEADGLHGVRVDREVEARGEGDRPEHAHRVLAQAYSRIADRADRTPVEVLEPSDVIDHRERGDVVEEGINGEVPAERVLLRGAGGIVAADERVHFVGL